MSSPLPLRLISSQKNSDRLQTLSPVPFKMLPIDSLEDYQLRRLRTHAESLKRTRPIAFLVLVRLAERLAESAAPISKIG